MHIPNWKGASPYPQLERGQSISPIGKGPVHIPSQKGAMQNAWIRAPYQKWPKKMPIALTLPLELVHQAEEVEKQWSDISDKADDPTSATFQMQRNELLEQITPLEQYNVSLVNSCDAKVTQLLDRQEEKIQKQQCIFLEERPKKCWLEYKE